MKHNNSILCKKIKRQPTKTNLVKTYKRIKWRDKEVLDKLTNERIRMILSAIWDKNVKLLPGSFAKLEKGEEIGRKVTVRPNFQIYKVCYSSDQKTENKKRKPLKTSEFIKGKQINNIFQTGSLENSLQQYRESEAYSRLRIQKINRKKILQAITLQRKRQEIFDNIKNEKAVNELRFEEAKQIKEMRQEKEIKPQNRKRVKVKPKVYETKVENEKTEIKCEDKIEKKEEVKSIKITKLHPRLELLSKPKRINVIKSRTTSEETYVKPVTPVEVASFGSQEFVTTPFAPYTRCKAKCKADLANEFNTASFMLVLPSQGSDSVSDFFNNKMRPRSVMIHDNVTSSESVTSNSNTKKKWSLDVRKKEPVKSKYAKERKEIANDDNELKGICRTTESLLRRTYELSKKNEELRKSLKTWRKTEIITDNYSTLAKPDFID